MLLIRDLKNMDKVDPVWINTFEEYIPKWLESLIPHYEVAKQYNADVLSLVNLFFMGDSEPDDMIINGIHYHIGDYPLLGRELAFNSAGGYYPCNWEDGFSKIYSEPVDKYGIPMTSIWLYTRDYLWRYLNRMTPYNELSKRIERLFQQMIGNDNVAFDFGSTSYILLNPSKKMVYRLL